MSGKIKIVGAVIMFATLLGSTIFALAQNPEPEIPTSVQSIHPGFSYQGWLEDSSGPYDGVCDMRFELYGSDLGSDQIGLTSTKTMITVDGGYFFISQLDFGDDAFNGDTRFLQIEVSCPSGSTYVTLSPRQVIMAVPTAMSLQGLFTRWNNISPNIIGGYNGNFIPGSVVGGTISGGGYDGKINHVEDNYGTVGGGAGNTTTGGWGNTIAGGWGNIVIGNVSTIAGGEENLIHADYATICGGITNTIEISGTYGTISGGQGNFINGYGATVPGGINNKADGDFSFAAGRNAKANHRGSFVWSDSRIDADFESLREYQFRVQSSGGVQFINGDGSWIEFLWEDLINSSSGAFLSRGGSWTNSSDVNLKENFAPVNHATILEKLSEMPTLTWNYKTEGEAVRHIGPTAQDFYASFGLGSTDKAISTVDAEGIALAAIQGLYEITQEQAITIEELQVKNDELETRLISLEEGRSKNSFLETLLMYLFSGFVLVLYLADRIFSIRSSLPILAGRKRR